MKQQPPWRPDPFKPKIDNAEVQAAILDLLMEKKELKTESFVRDLKPRWGATPIMHGLRRLREMGYIHRGNMRAPWSLRPKAQ